MMLYKNEFLIGKTAMPKIEEANEQNHYTVPVVKRTAGCTENQGS